MSAVEESVGSARGPVVTRLVERGFGDPVSESQAAFRSALGAFANPGIVQTVDVDLPDIGIPTAALATLLCLVDGDTPLWASASVSPSARAYLRFHVGARFANDRAACPFAFVADIDELPDLGTFSAGSAMSPEESATVILVVADFESGASAELTGPGCKSPRRLAPAGFTDSLWRQLATNRERFPMGVDLLLASGSQLVGLPRSTRISPDSSIQED